MISSIDFYPTLLEMAGLKPKPQQKFDGISIVPALQGETLRRRAIFCHYPRYRGQTRHRPSTYVRYGDWKLIRFYADGKDQRDRFELYNLREDVGESRDLAEQAPARVQELNAMIDEFLRNTQAVVPKPNPTYRTHTSAAGYGGAR